MTESQPEKLLFGSCHTQKMVANAYDYLPYFLAAASTNHCTYSSYILPLSTTSIDNTVLES
jgi:hypothetical protein